MTSIVRYARIISAAIIALSATHLYAAYQFEVVPKAPPKPEYVGVNQDSQVTFEFKLRNPDNRNEENENIKVTDQVYEIDSGGGEIVGITATPASFNFRLTPSPLPKTAVTLTNEAGSQFVPNSFVVTVRYKAVGEYTVSVKKATVKVNGADVVAQVPKEQKVKVVAVEIVELASRPKANSFAVRDTFIAQTDPVAVAKNWLIRYTGKITPADIPNATVSWGTCLPPRPGQV